MINFFSSEGKRFENKLILEYIIYEITGIAASTFRGDILSNFNINERILWAEYRNTILEKNNFYYLFGIFNVSMSLIYREGRDRASRQL